MMAIGTGNAMIALNTLNDKDWFILFYYLSDDDPVGWKPYSLEMFMKLFLRHNSIIFSAYKVTIKRKENQRKVYFSLFSRAKVTYLKLRISEQSTK